MVGKVRKSATTKVRKMRKSVVTKPKIGKAVIGRAGRYNFTD